VTKHLNSLRVRWRSLLLQLTPRSRRFHLIYRHLYWGKNPESLSGRGSTLEATKSIRTALPELLDTLNCSTLLDLGCGDFNWMKEVPLACNYIGADIVDEIITRNIENFSRNDRTFIVLDGTASELPLEADVVLCREVLFHLSNKDIVALLSNLKRSNAKFLICTNIESVKHNTDIFTGGFRQIDLRLPPFCFPEPTTTIPDQGVSANRYLCVWRVSDIP